MIVQQDSTYKIYNTVIVANHFLPTVSGISVCGYFYMLNIIARVTYLLQFDDINTTTCISREQLGQTHHYVICAHFTPVFFLQERGRLKFWSITESLDVQDLPVKMLGESQGCVVTYIIYMGMIQIPTYLWNQGNHVANR